MPDTSVRFDFKKRVAYDAKAKRLFHRHARAQLLKLAEALGLQPGEYDLRSNEAGIAVSGEITLHADRLYVQASQSAMAPIPASCSALAKGGATTPAGATISPRSTCCTGPTNSPR
jgi:hypothetical protein